MAESWYHSDILDRVRRITSRQHPVVLRARAIAAGTTRGMLLDGVHLVESALDAGRTIHAAIVAGDACDRDDLAPLIERLSQAGVDLSSGSGPVMAAASPVRSPSPIVAIGDSPIWAPDGLFKKRPPLLVIAADIQDPGNVGAIVRVAEAAGASGVVAAGVSADPFSWKALRGSMGSALRLPVRSHVPPGEAIADARRHGCRIIATVPRGGRDLYASSLTGSVAILIGSEGAGLDRAIVDHADEHLTIPMEPSIDSLNTATAAAVILFEARRQRTCGM